MPPPPPLKDKLIEHKQYIDKYGEDLPEIWNWKWPATDPANAGVRDAFCLNTFPPAQSHGNGPQPPTPAPATTPMPGK